MIHVEMRANKQTSKQANKLFLITIMLTLLCAAVFAACTPPTPPEPAQLSAPSNLAGDFSRHRFTWDKVENASGYTIIITKSFLRGFNHLERNVTDNFFDYSSFYNLDGVSWHQFMRQDDVFSVKVKAHSTLEWYLDSEYTEIEYFTSANPNAEVHIPSISSTNFQYIPIGKNQTRIITFSPGYTGDFTFRAEEALTPFSGFTNHQTISFEFEKEVYEDDEDITITHEYIVTVAKNLIKGEIYKFALKWSEPEQFGLTTVTYTYYTDKESFKQLDGKKAFNLSVSQKMFFEFVPEPDSYYHIKVTGSGDYYLQCMNYSFNPETNFGFGGSFLWNNSIETSDLSAERLIGFTHTTHGDIEIENLTEQEITIEFEIILINQMIKPGEEKPFSDVSYFAISLDDVAAPYINMVISAPGYLYTLFDSYGYEMLPYMQIINVFRFNTENRYFVYLRPHTESIQSTLKFEII
ncbi:MAG: hypothetical protein FWH03_03830 [Firmicutes bacterium]|nr:hypothetical protein [Bacillota bacterium]